MPVPARILLPLLFLTPLSGPAVHAAPTPINYNRDIRPILAENCYACHGFDANKRKAGLRLDVQAIATKPLKKSGNTAIVPGDPDHSALVERILTDDPDDHMPPPETGKKLTPAQTDLLRRW